MLSVTTGLSVIRKAPGWVWLALLALIVAALIYFAGQRSGKTIVHRVALADSVKVQRRAIDTATKKADSAVVVASVEAKKAAPLRNRARAAVEDTSNHVPITVINAVVAALTQDSTTIAKKDAAIVALQTEILERVTLDTLTEHQLVLKPPDTGGLSFLDVVKDVAIIAVVVEAVRWLLTLVH